MKTKTVISTLIGLCIAIVVGAFFVVRHFRSSNIKQEAGMTTQSNTPKKHYTVKRLHVKYDNNNLFGEFYSPDSSDTKRRPTVILSHGLTSSADENQVNAETLAAAGFNAYIFDFAGGSDYSRSTGTSTTEMSIFTEAEDLKAVVKTMQARDDVDSSNLFLTGQSQGGAVAAMVANDLPNQFKGLVLEFPAFIIPDEARQRFESASEIPARVNRFMTVGRAYYANLLDYDMWDHIKHYDGNVLIIHGTADETVPIRYSERAVETYRHAELIKISGAGHGFFGQDETDAANAMTRFVQKQV